MHRTFSIVLALRLFAITMGTLRAQNTISFQYCNAIAAGARGCALGENPIDCFWLQGIYDACIANAIELATPTPPPPSPSTPCTNGTQPEARPASGSEALGFAGPTEQVDHAIASQVFQLLNMLPSQFTLIPSSGGGN